LAGSEDEELDHGWGELDNDAARTDETTNRLAVCHMDWDRIRASDLMVLFSSFLPQGGLIHSVTVCVLFVRCITRFMKVINARRMRWADHVRCMGLMRNTQSHIKEGKSLKLKLWAFWNIAPFWAAVLCRWRQYTFPKRWLVQYLS
jgi:hypothetical protein